MEYAPDGESVKDKHNRAVEMLKSRIASDEEFLEFAHKEACYHECMDVRSHLLEMLNGMYWQ